MTLSLAAVFIPMLFMAGILGRLFREFAVTICAAILISGMVSITLTPMLCSRFLRHVARPNWLQRSTERFFDGMLHVYDRSLGWVLRHRPVMLVVFRGRAGRHRLPVRQWCPRASFRKPTTTNLSSTARRRRAPRSTRWSNTRPWSATCCVQEPERRELLCSASAAATSGIERIEPEPHVMVNLMPRRQRAAERRPRSRTAAAQAVALPGRARVCVTVPQAIRVGGRMLARAPTISRCRVRTRDELYRRGAEARARDGADCRSLQDVNTDLQIKNAAREHRCGSRPSGRAAPERGPNPADALRRVRPAMVVHHLRAHQPIQGAAGNAAEIPAAFRTSCPRSTSNRTDEHLVPLDAVVAD